MSEWLQTIIFSSSFRYSRDRWGKMDGLVFTDWNMEFPQIKSSRKFHTLIDWHRKSSSLTIGYLDQYTPKDFPTSMTTSLLSHWSYYLSAMLCNVIFFFSWISTPALQKYPSQYTDENIWWKIDSQWDILPTNYPTFL